MEFIVFIDNFSNKIITSVFRKNKFSGVLTNNFCFTSMSYKIGLVKCLIDRAYRINNTWLGFDLYPEYLLCNITRNYLNKKLNNGKELQKDAAGSQRFFNLPYIGKFSVIASF